ncbi:hypothetical protein OGAPHI_006123 [Ogataea philodendri]|uniref:VASt domain-containing protein n=3 Tax=Saccharomycotina TaxID=147537 RepID=A0A9P8NYS4_9ASCO|nr:uncharacterized protein OGAPHI_006123 [Ogataea philodendri]KAH3661944.1 hypothetical protein OGAPHI_006123 [Ogataea philodendri]
MPSDTSKSASRGASFRLKSLLKNRKSQSSVSSSASTPSRASKQVPRIDTTSTSSSIALPSISPVVPNDSISRIKSKIREHTRHDSDDDEFDGVDIASSRSLLPPPTQPKQPQDPADSVESTHSSHRDRNGGGLLTSIMNSFNLRSQTSLPDPPPVEEPQPQSPEHTQSPAENIEFKPVKTSILTTLGQGALSLDQFPKPDDLIEFHDTPFSGLNSGSTRRTASNTIVDPATSVSQISSPNTNTPTEEPRLERILSGISKRALSPNPVSKSSSATALYPPSNNTSFVDDEGSTYAKRPRLRDKRNSTTQDTLQLSRHTTTVTDIDQELNARREKLAEQLGIKLPSQKRQDSFHQMFPEIPSNELFIEDYTCAYRKDVLIHGRMYVSENHISFHSNLIGLITHITVTLNKVLMIKKKKTVGIPNALEFTTLHDKYTFASFISRDSTYELLVKIWSSILSGSNLNTVDLDVDSEADTDDPESEESDDGDDSKLKNGAAPNKSLRLEKEMSNDSDSDTDVSDKENMIKDDDEVETRNRSESHTFRGIPFDGPLEHDPSSNPYVSEPGDVEIINEVIAAPVGAVFYLLFGSDTQFLKSVLKTQKNTDISEIGAFDETTKKRSYSYTKPLNGPVGPKQTKCNVVEEIEKNDFQSSCLVTQITDTPDVPSGNSFKVKTRIYLSWAARNSTKMYIVTSVIWTAKSWIKGAVEKGTISGQKESLGILVKEVKARVESGRPVTVSMKKSKSATKKKRRQVEEREEIPVTAQPAPPPSLQSTLLGYVSQVDVKTGLLLLLVFIMIWDKLTRPAVSYTRGVSDETLMASEAHLWDWIDQRHQGNSNTASAALSSQQLNEVIRVMEKRLDGLKNAAR